MAAQDGPNGRLQFLTYKSMIYSRVHISSDKTKVISSHRYVLSRQFKPVQSITQPSILLAGWKEAVGSNSLEKNLYNI